MAQTGFTPISNYYSSTATNVPTAGNLVAGELAINTADGKLFYKDSSGVVQTIASKSAAALANSTTGSGATVLATSPTITNPSLGGSTSGSVTLAVPAVAGSNTATLPAATGTIMVSGNQPAFSAYQTAGSQTFSNGAYTKIIFNAEEFDTANAFDSTTNYRFTPQVAGYYQFTLAIAPPSTSRASECQLAIYKNGSAFKTSIDIYAPATYICNMSALIYLNGSTDYIEGYAYFGVGGNTAGSNYQNTYLQGSLVRSA